MQAKHGREVLREVAEQGKESEAEIEMGEMRTITEIATDTMRENPRGLWFDPAQTEVAAGVGAEVEIILGTVMRRGTVGMKTMTTLVPVEVLGMKRKEVVTVGSTREMTVRRRLTHVLLIDETQRIPIVIDKKLFLTLSKRLLGDFGSGVTSRH